MAASDSFHRVDREIVARMREGHEPALEELYDRHASRLYAVALRVLRRREDAEEVLQDTWVEAWRRAPQYCETRGTVRAWLHTMVRSRALDRYRSRSARSRAETRVAEEFVVSDEAAAVGVASSGFDARDQAVRLLSDLPDSHRQVLEIAYFEGLSQTEICEKLDLPLGTIKTWMRRGLQTLREKATANRAALRTQRGALTVRREDV